MASEISVTGGIFGHGYVGLLCGRQLMIDRFLSAVQSLDERDLEIAVRQAEVFGAAGTLKIQD